MRLLRPLIWTAVTVVIVVGGAWFYALHTTSGARLIWSQVVGATDGALAAKSVDGAVANGLRINGVRFSGDGLIVSAEELTATIDVDLFPIVIDVEVARATSVTAEIREASDAGSAESDIGDALNGLVLPVPVRVSDFQAHDISIDNSGDVMQITRVELVALWYEDISIQRLRVQNDDVDASADAHIGLKDSPAFSVNAHALVAPNLTGASEPVRLRVNGSGDLLGVDVVAEIGDFASVDGAVRWENELTASADILLRSFSPALWGLDWPQGFTVDGEVHASLDGAEIVISDSQLRIPAADALVDINGELDRKTDQVMGALQWSSLRWPLPEDQVRVSSDAGDVSLSGTIDSWTVIGDVAVGTEHMPDGRFSLDAGGTRDAAHARIIEGSIFGGAIAGEVEYEWRAGHPWSAVLDIAAIELSSLVPDWPGNLSGHVDGAGTARPFSMQATLKNVTGVIRDAELVANGAIDVTGNDVTAHNLRIEHGASQVSLDGSLTSSDGLQFTGVLADASDYASDARGGLEATGHISVTDSALAFALSATSPMLAYGEVELKELVLNIAGDDELQTLDLSANHLGTGLLLGISGAFENWRQPLASTWRGKVGEFGIDLDDEHTMALAAAAPVGLSKTDITLQEFCIEDGTGASLCADIEWHEAGNYAGSLAVQDVPVRMVEHLVETGLNFEQRISGELNWRHDRQAGNSGDGRLSMSAGTVSSADNAALSVLTGDGTIDFAVVDGALLSADLDLPMPGSGTLTGHFAVLDVRRFGDSRVSGLLDADISDVALLSLLIPEIDSASGGLRAHVDLEGTLDDPLLTGELELQGASFEYSPIGLSLQDVNLTGHLNENYQANLIGSFRSGDGIGELVSSADYSDVTRSGLRFHLQGDNLTLVDVPDMIVAVNADVDVTLDADSLSIDGKLVVPRARIRPSNLTVSRVNESRDVVIVEGELPYPPEEDVSGSNIEYSGKLEVTLGDSVIVDLDRARATIGGGAIFEWQGGVVPIANGRYDISGNVAAFGQVLDIEEGAVRFSNVSADKPFIRIIAEREIYGNTQVKQAGVLIEGPVNRLRVDPFTVPMTTEERALTLLVTGSDFDFEQGVGAIDFGTYIAPRLFVSYGVGVFERENIVSARFDLSKRFGIKASSGSKESGVDLNYRFEN